MTPADDELFPGEIGEGATAGQGALPCRVLTSDELRRMIDCAMKCVKEVKVPGDAPGTTETVYQFVVSGRLDGREVKDAIYTSEVGERFVAGGFEELTEEEWFEKYAPPAARAARGGNDQ